MASDRDLFKLIIDHLEYDFCEDSDEIQGTWEIDRTGDTVTISYVPFDDSPYPADTMTYRITRIDTPLEANVSADTGKVLS